MEQVDDSSRHRSAMAALNRLDMDKVARDNAERHHKGPPSGLTISTVPLLSPTTTYPGPPPPYSCSSATPSNLGAFDYISPPSSRRTTVDDKATGVRQSLPSIQEALGGDSTIPFSASNLGHPLAATSRIPSTSGFGPGQSLPEAPTGPSNPFSQGPAVGQIPETDRYVPRLAKHQDCVSEQERTKSAFPSINTTEPPSSSVHTYNAKSPSSRPAQPMPLDPFVQSPHANNYAPPSKISPSRYPPYRSPYPYATESSNTPSSTFPPVPDYSRFNPAFKFDDRKPPIPRSHPVQPYSDSVKRHLDIFDIELALNEVRKDNRQLANHCLQQQVTEGSRQAHEFSRHWSERAHQRQRNDQLPESLPSVAELDDLMRQSGRVVEALSRIKEAVIAQQHALAEEQARALKRDNFEDDMTSFTSEFKENSAFSTGDSKKRRGKAAPPGRCHSCNRAETPEWRRGPDGARTLCNACGLHYAKLTRKMAVNKNAALSGSNLRPKNSDVHPTM